jgi:antitoxin MazE
MLPYILCIAIGRYSMRSTIQKWGNSQGIRINKEILEQSHLAVGDKIEVFTKDGQVILQPIPETRKRYRLKDLVARIPKGYKPSEKDFGVPVGKEEW